MKAIHVVGVGPGNADYLTADALSVIDHAELVWCAQRHANLVRAGKCRPLMPFRDAIADLRREHEAGRETAVLVSGDTGLYSMLGMLRETFGAEQIEVHPGISALQLFCAELRTEWQDACILSAYGRSLTASALCHHVRTNRRTFLFLDTKQDPQWVWGSLTRGIPVRQWTEEHFISADALPAIERGITVIIIKRPKEEEACAVKV